MPAAAIIGGQYGSEGKGKVAAYLAPTVDLAIRTGGPNAGHTFEHNGRLRKVRSIPCAVVNPHSALAIGAGGVLDVDVLLSEVERFAVRPSRLMIDPQATLISKEDLTLEQPLVERIGSTGCGVGAAAARKLARRGEVELAGDNPALAPYLTDVAKLADEHLQAGKNICLEGTQGLGLSLHHGTYPYVTSRDTTAAALCSEAGVSPRWLTDVVLVLRTFPIRVAGNSGPLRNELDWGTVGTESGAPHSIVERTTVTGQVRRVGRFDMDMAVRSCLINKPTQIALNFADTWTSPIMAYMNGTG